MDGLRAMREARFAEQNAPAAEAAVAPPKGARTKKSVQAKAVQAKAVQPTADHERLCGHRAISGRTCTREHGHSQKSHRYA